MAPALARMQPSEQRRLITHKGDQSDMPAVPKRRTPRSRRDRRRASTFPKAALPTLLECEECGELVRPYHVCSNCGTYRRQQVIEVAGE
jgi:large subunit ribosomal protein L32